MTYGNCLHHSIINPFVTVLYDFEVSRYSDLQDMMQKHVYLIECGLMLSYMNFTWGFCHLHGNY